MSSKSEVAAPHDATPWTVQAKNSCYRVTPSDNEFYTIAKVSGFNFQMAKANAQFIVKAVNCHEDLLEACKMALDAMKEQQMANAKRGEPVLVSVGMAMQACDKAISQATNHQKEGTK